MIEPKTHLRQLPPENHPQPKAIWRPLKAPITVSDLLSWSDAICWDPAIKPAAKALANLVRSRVDKKTGYAFFSDNFGTLHTGYNRRTLTRSREQLVEADYLVTWRPSRTSATEYYPRIQTAREFLAELKADRMALRTRAVASIVGADSDDEIPF